MKSITDEGIVRIKRAMEDVKHVCSNIIEGSYDCRIGAKVKYRDMVDDEYVVVIKTVRKDHLCPFYGVPSIQEARSDKLPDDEDGMCDSFRPGGKRD